MRRAALAVPALLTAALAPSATACTVDNCVEVRTATAAWNGDDLHSLSARCVVVGRTGSGFRLVAEADGREVATPAVAVTVRCVAYARGVPVLDRSERATGPVATLAADFGSAPNVRVCVEAVAEYADGHSVDAGDCA